MTDKIQDIKKNKKSILRALKFFICLGFLSYVIHEYGIEIFTQYGNKSSYYISSTMKAKDFTMPPITICTQNGLKPSVLEKHGATNTWYYIFDIGWNQNISSVWDDYINASYLLNRDFEITGNFFEKYQF